MWALRFNHLGILDCVILMEDVSQYTQKDLIFIQDFFFNDFDQYHTYSFDRNCAIFGLNEDKYFIP